VIYQKKENVIARRIVGEMLLVPIRGSLADMEKLYVLDEVGEQVWVDLDGERSLQDILDRVCVSFDVNKDQAKSDVEEYISELQSADLIEEVK